MHGPFSVIAEAVRPVAVITKQRRIADLEERAVDDLNPVRPSGHQDLAVHVVEVIARVLLDLHAAGKDRHLERSGEVRRAEDDGFEPRRCGADLLHVDEATGALDLCLDADVAGREPAVELDLGEEKIECDDLGGASAVLGSIISSSRSPACVTTSITSP